MLGNECTWFVRRWSFHNIDTTDKSTKFKKKSPKISTKLKKKNHRRTPKRPKFALLVTHGIHMYIICQPLKAYRTETNARIQAQIVHYACREHMCWIYSSFTKVHVVEISNRSTVNCLQRCFIPLCFIIFCKMYRNNVFIICFY